MPADPRVAVIVVSFNTRALLRDCLASITEFADPATTEIVVVDNASSDGSAEMVSRGFPAAKLIVSTDNRGFGAANNLGVQAARAEYIVLLNSDALLSQHTVAGLVDYLETHPDICCAAPRIVLPDGRRQPRVFGNQPDLRRLALQALPVGSLFPRNAWLEGTDGSLQLGGVERHVGWVSGVCMAMRRADFLAIGGFDETIFMYCEDVDLCARLARGGAGIVRIDRWDVLHHGGASSPGVAAQVRSTVWAQRNLLQIVRRRSGAPAAALARPILMLGIMLRIVVGVGNLPRRGLRRNLLLHTSWARLRDLIGIPAGCRR